MMKFLGHKIASLDDEYPIINFDKSLSIPFHLEIEKSNSNEINGVIEPLRGRVWDEERGPGRAHSNIVFCWMPGSN